MQEMFERAEHRMTAFGRAFGLQTMARGVTERFAARREGREVPADPAPAGGTAAPAPKNGDAAPATPAAAVWPPFDDTVGRVAAPPGDAGANGLPPTELAVPPLAGGLADPPAPAGAEAIAPAEPRPLVEVLREALAKAAEALASPEVRVDDIVALTATALLQGWVADEVVLLVERGKGSFTVVGGAGERWRGFKLKMGFRREDRHVLGVAATRGEPVLIHDASDAKIDPYLPPWFKAGLQLFSCVIVPGGEGANAHSVVLTGWRVRQKVHLSPEETRTIRALLGMVQAARRLTGA